MSDNDKKRAFWQNFSWQRPENIETPGPGQTSVWDFPRPPRVEVVTKRVRIEFAGVVIADTENALRICETASPPGYYLPPDDINQDYIFAGSGQSFCEWKGAARYWDVVVGQNTVPQAAWSYPNPDNGYDAIKDHLAFYAQKMDACYVGDELVRPQDGEFYGGWITSDLTGPFKGAPGTRHW